jgi:hypothetical protein
MHTITNPTGPDSEREHPPAAIAPIVITPGTVRYPGLGLRQPCSRRNHT